ncbi:hypothetical protein M758_2G146900 [Ceratodon purpureus]|nr:hypothetical protein M758_2G146900 [Ceratodon purpureus]
MTKSSKCRIPTRVFRHCLLLLRISSSFQYVDKMHRLSDWFLMTKSSGGSQPQFRDDYCC